eukprot:1768739-Amphidinium_carterae.1
MVLQIRFGVEYATVAQQLAMQPHLVSARMLVRELELNVVVHPLVLLLLLILNLSPSFHLIVYYEVALLLMTFKHVL